MRSITVSRYVTPLREGGSMPAVVEGDDLGVYVLKFRGAGQGVRALLAEIIAGGIARALGLPVPEIVLAQLDPALARTEPDPEIQDLIRASEGLNVALDYLSGAVNFDPAVDRVTPDFASRLVWFDTLVGNVDRTARNTNLLMWHRDPWLIDHGASLTFHHAWNGAVAQPAKPFAPIADHVLLPQASLLAEVDPELAGRLTPQRLQAVLGDVPDAFLALAGAGHAEGPLADPATHRQAYVDHFTARLAGRQAWLKGAIDARG
ncbi:aminotransferase class I and II [Acidovorax sp. GBBC 3334]|uniref:HipA family kinase n=1 Tax=Acidovorax sp. GBBC 3334 TaxID=2940496 RepID=UPI002303CC29|nr:HipA family kinase [Acidovorax sp. GBBC 3334]MDA8454213.1 aminotransferase class I and II [Acidovorax sp. GBBC 3334]